MASVRTPAAPESGPIVGVSWPRSGHHMLVRLLQLYFGPGFGYCDFYGGKPKIEGIDVCCGRIPCRHVEKVRLTKSHDFDLDLPQIPGQKYLIQYRDFAPSVVSNFELFVRNGGEDSLPSFRTFASTEFTRYLGFIQRWVQSDFARNQLVLNYSTFLSDPHAELARAITFIEPGTVPDEEGIARAIANVDGQEVKQKQVKTLRRSGVHPERALSDFRHYSPHLREELENLRLPRASVVKAFRNVLGRGPKPTHMLRFQSYATIEDLEAHLRDSDEYRALQVPAPRR